MKLLANRQKVKENKVNELVIAPSGVSYGNDSSVDVSKFLTYGADPEILLFDNEENRVVSAIPVLGRDKNIPYELSEYVKFYYDNTMAEFTVRPADSIPDFIKSIRESLESIHTFLTKTHGNKYSIKVKAAHVFDDEFLDHDDAKKIGCDPEYCAYIVRDIVPDSFVGGLRSCGGHIVCGHNKFNELTFEEQEQTPLLNLEGRCNLTKLLDYYLAVPMILVDNDPTATIRKQLYGSCGRHRAPVYGLEYRVLSNFWIQSPRLVDMVARLATFAVEQLHKNNLSVLDKISKEKVFNTVKTGNRVAARHIVEILNLPTDYTEKLNELGKVQTWDIYKEWSLK